MGLRPATPDDREAIRTVARAAWHDTYDDIEGETIDATIDDWYGDESFESVLEQPGTAVLVAERDDEVVGFAHGVVHDDEGDILRMYVHPDHQDEGIGTALHERLREDLEDFNMNRMRAIDLESNEASREFYEGQGFERTDEATVELGDEEYTEAVYTLEL
ncbi:N-acetyltransferase [Salinadaptatus halalkaliphilus]|uniref:N-acetyltransferase n=1 Tax=Salinadaptatus halalkaliphilus TaxID=2419781 RepID=A0A4S3TPJ5_9EURY|nr:GNAT family N-acetyltransferase [Salinadaptatus halalkaliphilus]THE66289.1 N-acetyltransferase [Salinadaptatus halalkaliphilus]